MEDLPVYRCCGELIQDLDHLFGHLRSHFVENQIYYCQIERCSYSTNQRKLFLDHFCRRHEFLHQLLKVSYRVAFDDDDEDSVQQDDVQQDEAQQDDVPKDEAQQDEVMDFDDCISDVFEPNERNIFYEHENDELRINQERIVNENIQNANWDEEKLKKK